MDSSWRDRAACLGAPDPNRWFDCVEDPETEERRIDEAALAQCRAACLRCPVRVECFAEAMADEQDAASERRFGVRAMTTPEQRASLYRRFAVGCPDCREIYDPAGLINGKMVCDCGEFEMHEVDDRGDEWLDRHSTLAARMFAEAPRLWAPGDRMLSPTAWAKELHVRKDDAIRVVRAMVRDGLVVKGERRGEYVWQGGRRAWRPDPRGVPSRQRSLPRLG